MKEVTEWNGKPRWMWCWDDISTERDKRYVVCILSEEEAQENNFESRVCTYGFHYKHCAEIEEEKRPCTREELLEILKKQGLPMLLCKDNGITYSIIRLNNEEITVMSVLGSQLSYDYRDLCNTFTLIDGTELWVEE